MHFLKHQTFQFHISDQYYGEICREALLKLCEMDLFGAQESSFIELLQRPGLITSSFVFNIVDNPTAMKTQMMIADLFQEVKF